MVQEYGLLLCGWANAWEIANMAGIGEINTLYSSILLLVTLDQEMSEEGIHTFKSILIFELQENDQERCILGIEDYLWFQNLANETWIGLNDLCEQSIDRMNE